MRAATAMISHTHQSTSSPPDGEARKVLPLPGLRRGPDPSTARTRVAAAGVMRPESGHAPYREGRVITMSSRKGQDRALAALERQVSADDPHYAARMNKLNTRLGRRRRRWRPEAMALFVWLLSILALIVLALSAHQAQTPDAQGDASPPAAATSRDPTTQPKAPL
ncbi:DUF3040 domain-containing protein [Streptomyces sp. NPDC058864]